MKFRHKNSAKILTGREQDENRTKELNLERLIMQRVLGFGTNEQLV